MWPMSETNQDKPVTPGAEPVFETPDKLWEAACSYFQWCDDQPMSLVTTDDGVGFTFPREAFYCWKGLCKHLGCERGYFTAMQERLEPREDEEAEGFKHVLDMIDNVIEDNKITTGSGELGLEE